LIDPVIGYERLIKGAFDKLRQAARGMPAVYIRQLMNLEKVMEYALTWDERDVLARQAGMILRASDESVPEKNDRQDVQDAFDAVMAARDRSPTQTGG
jgi:uncharacterized membrane protein